MDYNKKILDALKLKDWDEIIKISNEAKYNTVKETMFGLRKGFVNVFSGYTNELEKELNDVGIITFKVENQSYLHQNLIKENIITKELVNNNFVVLLITHLNSVAKLHTFGFSSNLFKLTAKAIGVKGTEYKKIVNDWTIDKSGNYIHKDVNRTFYNKTYLEYHLKDLQTGTTYKFKEKTFAGLFRENRINSILE